MSFDKIAIAADIDNDKATEACARIAGRYGFSVLSPGKNDLSDINVVIALGGDGFMLHMLHEHMYSNVPIYGMNCGTVGFLMNEYREEELTDRLNIARKASIHPLKMFVTTASGEKSEAMAVNEVSLLRAGRQAAKIQISLGNTVHMNDMTCDGILVATPAGSSAYNYSIGGPILPLKAELIALTPISPFRPRRWRGAILPWKTAVRFDVLEHKKRPVNAVADFTEIKDVVAVEVRHDDAQTAHLLFDPGHSLEERILREQFAV